MSGGLIAFFILNPHLEGKALLGDYGPSGDRDWLSMGIPLGAVIGLAIGACLVASEEWHTRNVDRILRKSLLGALAGMACGALGGLDGQFVFAVLHPLNPFLARVIGWALMGAGAGICPGMVARSTSRITLGAYGGLIGGAVGGVLFDLLALITRNGDLSRLLGFLLVGAAIGIAVGFLEEMTKDCWLTVLTGAKEGQSFILSKDETTIGRHETVDISLFGDNSVQTLHARVIKSELGVQIAAEPGSSLTINHHPSAGDKLTDGDIIGIGKHRLQFRARGPLNANPMPVMPQQMPLVHATWIQVVSGPHSGAAFPLSAASMFIGKNRECHIALPNDDLVSMQHARVFWDGANWRIEDRGSANGVFVNGHQVSAQIIRRGDCIKVGGSTLRAV